MSSPQSAKDRVYTPHYRSLVAHHRHRQTFFLIMGYWTCRARSRFDMPRDKARAKEYQAEYRARNKERLKEKQAEYYARNKAKFKEKSAEYRARNKEQRKEYNAEYYARNKAQVKEYNAEFRAHPLQRLKMRIRDRLRNVKRCGRTNLDVRNAERFIGCTWEQILEHLGGDIPSGYELDHIIPLCKYDLNNPEDLHNAFNYRNTQLLPSPDHRKKGTKLPDQSVLLQLQDLWPVEWQLGVSSLLALATSPE